MEVGKFCLIRSMAIFSLTFRTFGRNGKFRKKKQWKNKLGIGSRICRALIGPWMEITSKYCALIGGFPKLRGWGWKTTRVKILTEPNRREKINRRLRSLQGYQMSFNVNPEFAKKYDNYRRKEELQKLKGNYF